MGAGQDDAANEPKNLRSVMIGGGGVGKSSLTIRFVANRFVTEYDPTIEDNYRKQIQVDGEIHMVEILDTAGEEEYPLLREEFMRIYDMFFLIFSITDERSFKQEIPERLQLIRDIKERENKEFFLLLVGNKSDLEEKREVTVEEAEAYAEDEGMHYVEASAKTGEGVEEMYFALFRMKRDGTHPQLLRQKRFNIKGAK